MGLVNTGIAVLEKRAVSRYCKPYSRPFRPPGVVEQTVKAVALKYGFKFATYDDRPTPSLDDTMKLFHSAVLVVGTSGAGLANIYFSRRGSYVVEIVSETEKAPLCFLQLTRVLGMRWHGIPATKPGFRDVHVSLDALSAVVGKYLELEHSRSGNRQLEG